MLLQELAISLAYGAAANPCSVAYKHVPQEIIHTGDTIKRERGEVVCFHAICE